MLDIDLVLSLLEVDLVLCMNRVVAGDMRVASTDGMLYSMHKYVRGRVAHVDVC